MSLVVERESDILSVAVCSSGAAHSRYVYPDGTTLVREQRH